MLHLHFGAGRLGLGLVAPFFQGDNTELVLLNRSAARFCETRRFETDAPGLTSHRRNQLLSGNAQRNYFIRTPGGSPGVPQQVRYDRFETYDSDSIAKVVASIVADSARAREGVVVTASLLQPGNYVAVIRALNQLSSMRQAGEALGPVFFVACENSFDACDVMGHPGLSELVSSQTRAEVTWVKALVDRLCVGLEEAVNESGPTICARAELYGSLKLELNDDTQLLADLCKGSKIEFSAYVDVEKQIKIWLLNGSHWLLALAALESTRGQQLNLNQYLTSSEENKAFARQIMSEMKEGVEIILRTDKKYAQFAKEIDVRDYLDGAASSILRRFFETEDPLTRILARFKAPTPEAFSAIEAFSKHFADRVGEPMRAYEHERGVAPPAASHSLLSMLQLVASGTFIEERAH